MELQKLFKKFFSLVEHGKGLLKLDKGSYKVTNIISPFIFNSDKKKEWKFVETMPIRKIRQFYFLKKTLCVLLCDIIIQIQPLDFIFNNLQSNT